MLTFAQSMAIRFEFFELTHQPLHRLDSSRNDDLRSTPDGVLLASGGTGKFIVCPQPLGALSTGVQVLPTADEAEASNNNRRHHCMASMGKATVPRNWGHPEKPCLSRPERAGQPMPGLPHFEHRHRSDPSLCSDGQRI